MKIKIVAFCSLLVINNIASLNGAENSYGTESSKFYNNGSEDQGQSNSLISQTDQSRLRVIKPGDGGYFTTASFSQGMKTPLQVSMEMQDPVFNLKHGGLIRLFNEAALKGCRIGFKTRLLDQSNSLNTTKTQTSYADMTQDEKGRHILTKDFEIGMYNVAGFETDVLDFFIPLGKIVDLATLEEFIEIIDKSIHQHQIKKHYHTTLKPKIKEEVLNEQSIFRRWFWVYTGVMITSTITITAYLTNPVSNFLTKFSTALSATWGSSAAETVLYTAKESTKK